MSSARSSRITSGARARISSLDACTDSACDVGEDVDAAGGLEHVVQESAAAAGVDVAQRSALAAEDQQRARLLQRSPCAAAALASRRSMSVATRVGLLRAGRAADPVRGSSS